MIQYRAATMDRPDEERVVELETVEQALLFACNDLLTGAARPLGIYDAEHALLFDAQSIQDRCIELADQQ